MIRDDHHIKFRETKNDSELEATGVPKNVVCNKYDRCYTYIRIYVGFTKMTEISFGIRCQTLGQYHARV